MSGEGDLGEMRDLLRTPLVRVAVLGMLVAAAILIAKGPPTADASRRVVITGADLLQLRAAFMRTWQREPTADELRGSLEQHIRQEVLYREALARGYDRDDLVVRRAMQQKMEFLAASQALQEPPTEEEIEAFFALRRERYRLPAVLILPRSTSAIDRRGAEAEADALDLLDGCAREDRSLPNWHAWGDPIMLDLATPIGPSGMLPRAFGGGFAEGLLALLRVLGGTGASGYGLHLVKVDQREDSRIPDWREVAGRVISDMEFEAKASSRDQLYQEIAQNYEIVVDNQVRDLLESVE